MSGTEKAEFPIFLRRAPGRHGAPHDAVALRAALEREQMLLREKHDLSQRQTLLADEFEHRLVNGLQMIVSLLSLQSRTAPTIEAAAQLKAAALRVGSIGRVHRQLHLLDHQDHVQFKDYLTQLCVDLSELLFLESSGYTIVVEGADVRIPTPLAIPLGFIVNELITNAAKYTEGPITVRIGVTSGNDCFLSVIDSGTGLPPGFKPGGSKGLGMKIVRALVKQINGDLHIGSSGSGQGTCCTIKFRLQP